MGMSNVAVGIVLMCGLVILLGSIFFPMFSNPSYNVPIAQDKFLAFNQSWSEIKNLSDTTKEKMENLNPDTNNWFAKIQYGLSMLDLYRGNVFSVVKLFTTTIPKTLWDIAGLGFGELRAPPIILSFFIAIVVIITSFMVIKIFFNVE